MWNAAENIYRVPYNQVTKKMYDEAKNGTYAANYNVGALKISRMYNMEFSQAKFILERYYSAVPEIKDSYQTGIRNAIDTTRTLVNPLGRERVFLGQPDDEMYRAAYSHYCQSTVADVINIGLVKLEGEEEWVEVLLQVHDELVVQVPIDCLEEGVTRVKKAMEVPLKFDGVDVPLVIPVEVATGPNWFELKKEIK
jgi:DNA polymerase-1